MQQYLMMIVSLAIALALAGYLLRKVGVSGV